MFTNGINEIDKSVELFGLYNRGSYQAYTIKFPYYSDATYVYFGSKTEAKKEAAKLQKEHEYIYQPSIRKVDF